jgi:hypothetical protein
MELFGIILSVPIAFVISMAYCAFLANVVRRLDFARRLLFVVSLILLGLFLIELLLLAIFGAVHSRAAVGPGFYVAHVFFFFVGVPALGNVLVLPISGPILGRWYFAGAICTLFVVLLVLLQYGVSEALYGVDGIDGPYR